MITPRKITLMTSTALGLAMMSGGAVAQSQSPLSNEEVAQLSDTCRNLLETVRNRDELPDGMSRDNVLEALRANADERCTSFREELNGGDTQSASASATDSDSATASDQETVAASERVRVIEEAVIEGIARVEVPKPDVDVEMPAPNVRVMTEHPTVEVEEGARSIEVRQEQPQISVSIPEIMVRVEIPAPKLFIQTEDPTVRVSDANPSVEIEQGEPRVTVQQGEPRIALKLDVGDEDASEQQMASSDDTDAGDGETIGNLNVASAEPQVTIEQPTGEPQFRFSSTDPEVTYDGSEPNVTFDMVQQPTVEIANVGQIEVTYETAEERDQRRQQQASSGQSSGSNSGQMENGDSQMAQSGSSMSEEDDAMTDGEQTAEAQSSGSDAQSGSGDMPNIVTIAELVEMTVVGANGQELGDVDALIRQQDELMMVISNGGFLGLGDKQVAVPLARIQYTPENLVLTQLTRQDFERARDFEFDPSQEVADDFELRVGGGN